MSPRRPVLRYMGGKWRLAPWIVSHFPVHKTYVEPYGGAASVLMRKPRGYCEIYNDLDGEVVNVFRVLREPAMAVRLRELLALTPFARAEFELTYEISEDRVENARRMIARSFMGFGSTAVALRRTTGFRANSARSNSHPAQDWMNLADALPSLTQRLQGVVIENRPALAVMGRFDGPDTLIYADPPYVHETRSKKRIGDSLEHAYAHEMTEAEHLELLKFLRGCESYVVLSGYRSPLYDDALADWQRIDKATYADGARPRVESLWLNPRVVEALASRRSRELAFEDAA